MTFTATAGLLTAVAFGLLPAIQASRTDMLRVTVVTGRANAGSVLVIAELALSVVLLVGAAQ